MLKGRVLARHVSATLLAVLLGSCGGNTEDPPQAVGGWVGERTAWAQARVTFTCGDGSTAQVISSATGRYMAMLPSAALPCLVQARATDGTVSWSAAVAAGTANVTTLSTAVVARALRTTPTLLFGSPTLAQRLTPALLADAQAALNVATSDLDLGSPDAAITTPIGTNEPADPLVRAHGRLIDQLAERGMTPMALTHALAGNNEPRALRDALAQGSQCALLALPPFGFLTTPQLVRGKAHTLAGSASRALLLGNDMSFFSDDGGRNWQPMNVILDQVIGYKNALIARSPDGLLRSTNDGANWAMVAAAPLAGYPLHVGPDLRLRSMHESGPQASEDGLNWMPAAASDPAHDTALHDVYRVPPLRSVISARQAPNRVRSCLGEDCTTVDLADLTSLQRVHGSDEVLAGNPLDGRMSISANGLQWQPLGPLQATALLPDGGMLRHASGRLLALLSGDLQASDDNGRTWQAAAPATPAKDWQALDSTSALRRDTTGALELSTDGGQRWHKVPSTTTWAGLQQARSPDGSMLRIAAPSTGQPGPVELSTDSGRNWVVVFIDKARSVAWLGDRFGAVVNGDLRVSRDGRQWTSAGTVPAFSWESSLAGAAGVWVLGFREYPTLFPHTLWESTDEGRTWQRIFFNAGDPSQNAASYAFTCGGVLFAERVGMWVRRPDGWKSVTLPEGTQAGGCIGDLLAAVDGSSGTRSHHVSADQGATWIPIGRPRTQPVFDGERWWSIGEASITLWPR